jgi:hypothetical protein
MSNLVYSGITRGKSAESGNQAGGGEVAGIVIIKLRRNS